MEQNNLPTPIGEEEILFQGRIVEVVRQKMKIGDTEKVFELARRSPGTRLIIMTSDNNLVVAPNKHLLISREYRAELKGWDYRLPGGKVFDSLKEYHEFLQADGNILEAAQQVAIKEAIEEVGIEVKEIEYLETSVCGATMEWDLIFFVVTAYTQAEAKKEDGENIEAVEVSIDEVKKLCLNGQMKEDRSGAVLLRFLHKRNQL